MLGYRDLSDIVSVFAKFSTVPNLCENNLQKVCQ